MKHLYTVYCLLLMFVIGGISYANSNQEINKVCTDSTVTDFDGNVYRVVKIGNQIWMAENLRTTHYSDGTPVEYSPGLSQVAHNDSTKRFFYYNNNSSYANNYGCLYNWFAAVRGTNGSSTNPSKIQGICPTGWHLPSKSEWEELISFLGENAATHLKPGGWTGFNAVFGGVGGDFNFQQMNATGFYLTSDAGDDFDSDKFCYIALAIIQPNDPIVHFGYHTKSCGYSVRCVKDNTNTGVSNKETSGMPQGFALYQNYPNPFNPNTTIKYHLTKPNNVTLTIFNLSGQAIETLVNGFQTAGEYEISWQADGLPSGIYFCRLQAGDPSGSFGQRFIEIKKLILQK